MIMFTETGIDEDAKECPNCGNLVKGKYCEECGLCVDCS